MAKLKDGEVVTEELLFEAPTQRRSNGHIAWKTGVKFGIATVTAALLINVSLLAFSIHKFGTNAGLSTLFAGNCDKVKSYSLWGHLGINALGTLILSSSNYCQQCLSAPTRADVDRAHMREDWLDIGIPSFRNLWNGRLGGKRVLLWWLLALGSVPFHWIYNSALFESLGADAYTVLFVSEEFISGPAFPPRIDDVNIPYQADDEGYLTNQTILAIRASMGDFQRLEPAECFNAYATQVASGRRDLVIVTNVPSYPVGFRNATTYQLYYSNPNITNSVLSIAQSSYDGWQSAMTPYYWICNTAPYNESLNCGNQAVLAGIASSWRFKSGTVQYCLSEVVPEKCEFSVNVTILAVIICFSLVKLICMISSLFLIDTIPLVTIGDAISSFIKNPDPTTVGMCTFSHVDFRKPPWTPQPRTLNPTRLRRHTAISRTRWAFCMICYVIILGTVLSLTIFATTANQMNLSDIRANGFGVPHSSTLLADIHGLITNILLSNIPQVVLSFFYLTYNAAITGIAGASEFAGYAKTRKQLRVSNPQEPGQRSRYFLNLPYRYSFPLIVLSGVLHWLVSQSLFLVDVNVYITTDGHTSSEKVSISNQASLAVSGYSVLPMIATLVLGGVMVIGLNAFGWMRFESAVPVAASCSAAISAACHGEEGSNGIMWGELKLGTTYEVGHLGFSGQEVEEPIEGRLYE